MGRHPCQEARTWAGGGGGGLLCVSVRGCRNAMELSDICSGISIVLPASTLRVSTVGCGLESQRVRAGLGSGTTDPSALPPPPTSLAVCQCAIDGVAHGQVHPLHGHGVEQLPAGGAVRGMGGVQGWCRGGGGTGQGTDRAASSGWGCTHQGGCRGGMGAGGSRLEARNNAGGKELQAHDNMVCV